MTKEIVYKDILIATGRRKTAIAKVFLTAKKGDFIVNDKQINEYFPSEKEQMIWKKPFNTVGVSHPESQYSATIKVSGSGLSSQLGAIVHGLARALVLENVENRTLLRKAGLMTRDSRMVERKKYFFVKSRKKPQYSKR